MHGTRKSIAAPHQGPGWPVLLTCLSLLSCGQRQASLVDGPTLLDRDTPDTRPGDLRTDHQAPDAAPPSLIWGPCDLTGWPLGYPTPGAEVQCTAIQVPLDHGKPAGPTITLNVARQKSRSFPTGKAVLNLAGGPGGSSVWQSGTIPIYMPKLLERFDMVYVDQRGTGRSGYLDCSAGYPRDAVEWAACAAEHADKDLGHHLTVDAAHDLNLVRTRLGYEKIYIRGGSYGTRLGLEFIRQHESSVAAAVLDGLAPPDWDIFGYGIAALDQAVELLIQDCAKSPACLTVSPDLAADLETRRLALRATPRKIAINGSTYYEDDETFAIFLYAAIDRSTLRYRIPRAVHQAVQGDHTLWNKLASDATGYTVQGASDPARLPVGPPLPFRLSRPVTAGTSYVAPGLLATVMCAEWLPNAPPLTQLKDLLAQQTWRSTDELSLFEGCAAWKMAPLPAALRTAVQSPAKVLLLSGAIDVRTPPAMGELALKTLLNGTHLLVPHASHSTISVKCVDDIIAAFFEAAGEMATVDTSCLAQVPQPPW